MARARPSPLDLGIASQITVLQIPNYTLRVSPAVLGIYPSRRGTQEDLDRRGATLKRMFLAADVTARICGRCCDARRPRSIGKLRLAERFNSHQDPLTFLILSADVSIVGLNLHHAHAIVYLTSILKNLA